MEPSWKITARTIVLSIILGGAAGVLTTSLTTNYLSRYALELGELTEPLRLSDERPRAFPQSYEEALVEVTEKVTPGLVEFYAPQGPAPAVSATGAIGHGVVLTSDGWLLSVSDPEQALTKARALVDGEMYPITEIIVDDVVGVVFVKVDAENLPVLAFGGARDVVPGEQLFTVPFREGLQASTVVGFDWGENVIWSTDSPNRSLAIASFGEERLGVPVANLGGELIGMIQSVEPLRVLPIETVLPGFTRLIRGGEISHASLGLSVIDLTRSLGLSSELTRGHHSGALVPSVSGGAVVRGGAAAEAGIQVGDIILAVDGQVVNGKMTLDEYILAADPESAVVLTIDRAGESLEIPVPLGVL